MKNFTRILLFMVLPLVSAGADDERHSPVEMKGPSPLAAQEKVQLLDVQLQAAQLRISVLESQVKALTGQLELAQLTAQRSQQSTLLSERLDDLIADFMLERRLSTDDYRLGMDYTWMPTDPQSTMSTSPSMTAPAQASGEADKSTGSAEGPGE